MSIVNASACLEVSSLARGLLVGEEALKVKRDPLQVLLGRKKELCSVFFFSGVGGGVKVVVRGNENRLCRGRLTNWEQKTQGEEEAITRK